MPAMQLVLAMIIWGTLGLFVLKSGLNSIDIAFFRCLIGVIFLAPYCWHKKYFTSGTLTRRTLMLIGMGGILVVLNWILLFESFHYASITLGNISYYLQPVFLLFLGQFFFKESVPYIKYFFILVSLVGVILTIDIPLETFQFHNKEVIGVGCALLAGFFYSIATIIAKKTSDVPAPMMTFLQLLVGGCMLLPLTHVTQISFTWQTGSYILILGIIHTVLAFVLYYNSVSSLSTDKIAVLSYIDPIAAIVTDVLFFDRILSVVQILGIAITLLGSYFVIDIRIIKKYFSRHATESQHSPEGLSN